MDPWSILDFFTIEGVTSHKRGYIVDDDGSDQNDLLNVLVDMKL